MLRVVEQLVSQAVVVWVSATVSSRVAVKDADQEVELRAFGRADLMVRQWAV